MCVRARVCEWQRYAQRMRDAREYEASLEATMTFLEKSVFPKQPLLQEPGSAPKPSMATPLVTRGKRKLNDRPSPERAWLWGRFAMSDAVVGVSTEL